MVRMDCSAIAVAERLQRPAQNVVGIVEVQPASCALERLRDFLRRKSDGVYLGEPQREKRNVRAECDEPAEGLHSFEWTHAAFELIAPLRIPSVVGHDDAAQRVSQYD